MAHSSWDTLYNYIFILNKFYRNISAIRLALSYSFLYLCISLPDALIRRMRFHMPMYYINPDVAPHFVCLSLWHYIEDSGKAK
jgi:hypothetical protein